VAAEHDDNPSSALRRRGDCVDHRAKVTRDKNVGKRVEERVKRPVVAGRMRELGRAHFVGAARDWNGADRRKIRFARS
jgi:hypothetical protein